MVVLWFGYARFSTTKAVALSDSRLCRRCGVEAPWILFRRRRWVDLFHIPLFPAGHDYFLACPCGESGYALENEEARLVAQGKEALGQPKFTPKRRDELLRRMGKRELEDWELATRARKQMQDEGKP